MTNEEIKYEVRVGILNPFEFESLDEAFEFIRITNPTEVTIKKIK